MTSLATVAYLGATHPLHPEPGRPVQPGDRAARQPVRHDRHGDRRAGDGVSARTVAPATSRAGRGRAASAAVIGLCARAPRADDADAASWSR